jgi:predicted DCC family thiol-disulfide oxidoreductase YuxK
MVNFIIRQDKKKLFRFVALQSAAGQRLMNEFSLKAPGNDSFILIEDNKAFQRSTAALKLYNKLPWYWKWTQVGWILPRIIRDGMYDLIARNRYRWFGKREQCMVPGNEIKERFLE